jgi:GDP-fucose transporter C1
MIFGVLSSLTTACHAVVIKKSLALDGIGGDALKLSWYTHVMSVFVLAPCVALAGEVPAVLKLLSGNSEYIPGGDEMSPLKTFLWGSFLTVRIFLSCFQSPF